MTVKSACAIRDAIREFPVLAAASAGSMPVLSEVFFPEGHAEALNPDVSLVIGNRGMGKTFWSLVLRDEGLRRALSKRLKNTSLGKLHNATVRFGFSDAEGAQGGVSRASIEQISKKVPPEAIWRAVIVRDLAELIKYPIPTGFKDLVAWVRDNPDQQKQIFRDADVALSERGQYVIFLFDQLDQLATDWNRIQQLTQGLLKMALALKSYKSLKIKIFMRPDQAEQKELFRFPDASKILGGSRKLAWRTSDLYGLFFFRLWQSVGAAAAIKSLSRGSGIRLSEIHPVLVVPEQLVTEPAVQGWLFDKIAGPMMGGGTKRGRPFTWIPMHLADARGEISPRTFLKVMKIAADSNEKSKPASAIDFAGILEGVREASTDRLSELEEDYPWISTALKPLKGLLVPSAPEDIFDRWRQAGTVSEITSRFAGSSAPIELVFADMFDEDGHVVLIKLLREVGVLEERSNGKVNIPDIFRVKAGILRKGGVAPQQRQRV